MRAKPNVEKTDRKARSTQRPFDVRSTHANRPKRGWSKSSIHWMRSVKPASSTSKARGMKVGSALIQIRRRWFHRCEHGATWPSKIVWRHRCRQDRLRGCLQGRRLSRSLLDFAKIIEVFDRHQVTFVSVTQSFNTASSMGRLTLNVLLSFAQFERDMISERNARQDASCTT